MYDCNGHRYSFGIQINLYYLKIYILFSFINIIVILMIIPYCNDNDEDIETAT